LNNKSQLKLLKNLFKNNTMPEFRVIESLPATQYWEYIVEAESEEDAIDIITNGEVEPTEAWTELDDDSNSTFEVYREDDDNNE
jgi:hypothetical protein